MTLASPSNSRRTHLAASSLFVLFLSAALAALFVLAAAPASAREKSSTGYFSVRQVNGKWTFEDPSGRPFYSIGVDHVSWMGGAGGRRSPHAQATDLFLLTVQKKYGTPQAWAAAQIQQFHKWGVNSIGTFSDVALFRNRDIPFTVFIHTADNETDFWNPTWKAYADSTILSAALEYKGNRNVIGYYIDNELSWTVDITKYLGIGDKNQQMFIMGRYFHYPHGKLVLLAFLKKRYQSLGELRADFPDANLPGTNWSTLDTSKVTLGSKVTPHGRATLNAWAGIMAHQYFSVVTKALRAADPHHLDLGLKMIGGLTPSIVLKTEAPDVDVISVDFYQPPKLYPGMASTANTLASWYRITGKPLLIGEFGYRASGGSGLPNTDPPQDVLPVLPNQKARGQAVENFANCIVDTSYFVGLHYFELVDEPAEGTGMPGGENSNWGLLNARDVPYTPVIAALTEASRVAAQRLHANFKPAACTPVGIQ